MKTLTFVTELGKTYKVDTFKVEIKTEDISASISNLERLIAEYKILILDMENDLKEFKKLL